MMMHFPRNPGHARRSSRQPRDARRLVAGSLAALAAVAALIGLTACGGDTGSEASQARAGRSDAHLVRVRSPLDDAGLATLGQASDAVVHGTVEAVETDVRIGSPELTYDVLTISVDQVLAGDSASTIEVAAATRVRGRAVEVEGRPALPEVGDDAVWFLVELAPQFGREGYVLTSPSGLVRVEGGDVIAPHHPHEAPPALAEAQELGSQAAIVDHVREVASAAG